MAEKRTTFQRLGDLFLGGGPGTGSKSPNNSVTYNIDNADIIFKTSDKNEYERKKKELEQEKLFNYQWQRSRVNNEMQSLSNLTNIQLMYRDADLMANEPEIGAALDIVMEEACCLNSSGRVLNIYSHSKRIQSILDDLFTNRLDINIMLPLITREMVKYGNSYWLLNLSNEEGVLGWMQQEVYSMQRLESGYVNPYTPNAGSTTTVSANDTTPNETKFVAVGKSNLPYHSYQIAHFRNLSDTLFLPYGTSWLHKARRAWRILMMMEDAMLIHRLDKSVERRIFKINVGGINEQDVQAYIQSVANNFKRGTVVDPHTGQVDLRKNFLDVSADYFIPVRNGQDPSSIETLNSAQYANVMDDIEYQHNKVLAALRVPKTFLNFSEAQGKGQNLSLMDIRFTRMIQRVQQSLLMELNKVAIIHLYLLGFTEDLTNFTLTMNNPSAQIDALELEDFTKRVQAAAAALADPGVGFPIVSVHNVLRNILKMTDEEIKDMLNEIRLEKALAAELQATAQVIRKTGIFNPVDRIYGDANAMYQTGAESNEAGMGVMGGPGGAMGAMGGVDGALNSNSLGGAAGDMGMTSMPSAPAADAGGDAPSPLNESYTELYKKYISSIGSKKTNQKETSNAFAKLSSENIRINESFDRIFNELDDILGENYDSDDESTPSEPQVL